jgi:hypothetical protein
LLGEGLQGFREIRNLITNHYKGDDANSPEEEFPISSLPNGEPYPLAFTLKKYNPTPFG